MQYMKQFPREDKLIAWEQSQFWPTTMKVNATTSMDQHGSALKEPEFLQLTTCTLETGFTVLDHLSPILQRGYFGPRRGKPQNITLRPTKKQRPNTKEVSSRVV